MDLTRREMAHEAGLSYDLLRHYERQLANVLPLVRSRTGEVMFPPPAQAMVHDAVRLKRDHGYSMKQIVQHFNGSSRVEEPVGRPSGCPPQPEADSPIFADAGAGPPSFVPAPRPAAVVLHEPSIPEAAVLDEGDARWSELRSMVEGFRQATDTLSSRLAVVTAPDFAANLTAAVERSVSAAVGSRMDALEDHVGLVAEAVCRLGQHHGKVQARSEALERQNEELHGLCALLAERLARVEADVASAERPPESLGSRFMNWFLGVREPQATAAAERPRDDFRRHFERFRTAVDARRDDGAWYLDFLGPLAALGRPRS